MMLTEQEAKERWCPFARVSRAVEAVRQRPDLGEHIVESMPGVAASNRPVDGACRCLGSACMAWRWVHAPPGESIIEAIKRHRAEHGSDLYQAKAYVEAHPEYRKGAPPPERGYCGLAGKAIP